MEQQNRTVNETYVTPKRDVALCLQDIIGPVTLSKSQISDSIELANSKPEVISIVVDCNAVDCPFHNYFSKTTILNGVIQRKEYCLNPLLKKVIELTYLRE